MESFVREIIEKHFPGQSQQIYEESLLIQYLDKKSGAIHGTAKTRRSLANYYAIYSILNFYVDEFFDEPDKYKKFEGYEYTKLFVFYRGLYGGSKLQNHALNSRVNGEFRNKVHADKDLIIINDGKYALHIDFLYVIGQDISRAAKDIIEKYVNLLMEKDHSLLTALAAIEQATSVDEKKLKISDLLTEDAEARIFEIISFAILKSHYKTQKIYIGLTIEEIHEEYLQLFKTGRTNANDGGIDFVMRPVGRFFQVTEVNNYDKYLLDIDKVLHFPISFVIKTTKSKQIVEQEIERYIEEKSGGMVVVKERYKNAFEEIITINEIKTWLLQLSEDSINLIISDIDFYYKMEMNLEDFSTERDIYE